MKEKGERRKDKHPFKDGIRGIESADLDELGDEIEAVL